MGFLYNVTPKVGPLRVLQFRMPTPEAEGKSAITLT
jgi:hypothetical protein